MATRGLRRARSTRRPSPPVTPAGRPEDVAAKVEALRQSGPEVVDQDAGGDRRRSTSARGSPSWGSRRCSSAPTLRSGPWCAAADGEAAARLPGVDYVMIPGGEHSIHRNRYEAFRDVLMDWLRPAQPRLIHWSTGAKSSVRIGEPSIHSAASAPVSATSEPARSAMAASMAATSNGSAPGSEHDVAPGSPVQVVRRGHHQHLGEHLGERGRFRPGETERWVVDQVHHVEAFRGQPGVDVLDELAGGEMPWHRQPAEGIAHHQLERRLPGCRRCRAGRRRWRSRRSRRPPARTRPRRCRPGWDRARARCWCSRAARRTASGGG